MDADQMANVFSNQPKQFRIQLKEARLVTGGKSQLNQLRWTRSPSSEGVRTFLWAFWNTLDVYCRILCSYWSPYHREYPNLTNPHLHKTIAPPKSVIYTGEPLTRVWKSWNWFSHRLSIPYHSITALHGMYGKHRVCEGSEVACDWFNMD